MKIIANLWIGMILCNNIAKNMNVVFISNAGVVNHEVKGIWLYNLATQSGNKYGAGRLTGMEIFQSG
jgi:hypothetical protein